ncbi:MAG: glycosyltransferase family 39 protein [Cellvibrionaceae bacterium]|nr:glycosyltransferase family 39 protein [Cellvibrionaceae bacterium]
MMTIIPSCARNTQWHLTPKHLFWWLLALTVYRLGVLLQPHLGVFFDEAYYAHWAQDPAFGYYSKPPMVAWLIALSSSVLGQTAIGIKVFAPLLYGISAWLVMLIGTRLSDSRTGVIAALLFSSAPIVGFNSLFITTDAPLFFFWAAASLVFLYCLETDHLAYWLLLGSCLGLGMLSKYSFAALPLGLLVFLVISGRLRYFWHWKCLLCAALALLIFSGNIVWNWQNDFIAVTHTKEISQVEGATLQFGALAEFLITQVAIFGIFWVLVIARKPQKALGAITYKDGKTLLWCLLLPILLVIGTQALLSRAFGNWAAPFVIAASIMTASALTHYRRRLLAVGLAFNLVFLSLFYHWPPLLNALNIEASRNNSPYHRLSGWRQLAQQSQTLLATVENKKLLSHSRELLAYIGFYTQTPATDLVYWRSDRSRIDNHYDLIANIGDLNPTPEHAFIYLSDQPLPATTQQRFEQARFIGEVRHSVYADLERVLRLYYLQGFKGYGTQALRDDGS